MQPDEIIEALEPWRRRVLRPAWRPVVKRDDGSPTASKFGGMPWTGPRAPWPECPGCKIPLALLLQLRLGDIPGKKRRYGTGLLQFFYCSRTGAGGCKAGASYQPFSDQATRVRIIRPTPRGKPAPLPPGYEPPEAGPRRLLPAQRIVGWKPLGDERPEYYEHAQNGLKIDYDLNTKTMRLECPELGFEVATGYDPDLVGKITDAANGDKLGGWPCWIQRLEYPDCPRCGEQMVLVFQVASGDHAQEAFGDFGTGHITQCPEHKDVVAFGSAR